MGRKFTVFALFYFIFEGKFKVQAPPPGGGGAYIRRDDLTEGFCVTILGGLFSECYSDLSYRTCVILLRN